MTNDDEHTSTRQSKFTTISIYGTILWVHLTKFDDDDDALLADLDSSRFFAAAGRQASEPVP